MTLRHIVGHNLENRVDYAIKKSDQFLEEIYLQTCSVRVETKLLYKRSLRCSLLYSFSLVRWLHPFEYA